MRLLIGGQQKLPYSGERKFMKDANNLLWLDLEMTGLNPEKDCILEIATLATDANLNILATGPSLVIHQPKLPPMHEWVQKTHEASGLLQEVVSSSYSLQKAEEATLAFIEDYCISQMSPLCGNSIWQDKRFLQKYMPKIVDYLNYRIVDVSSIKVLVRHWYANNPLAFYEKPETHRALNDIYASLDELKHYRTYFFVKN